MPTTPAPLMTGARQTMMSWARVIDGREAVPEIYQASYQALVGAGAARPYTVLAPAQAGARGHRPAERLLCDLGEALYVLEAAGRQVSTSGFRYADICSFEVGNILLYSWFSIHGRAIDGGEAAATVEFNEATLRHFAPFFKKMRPAPSGADPIALAGERAKLDSLAAENFKLMNFGRECLVPGQPVLQVIYQPGKRQPVLNVLGRSLYRTLFLAHLAILTGREIILIGDAENVAEKERSKYGGVQRYLPLHGLVSVTLEAAPIDLLKMTFRLAGGVQVEKLFDAAHRSEVEALKQRLEELMGLASQKAGPSGVQ